MSGFTRCPLLRVSEKEGAAVRAAINIGDEDSIRRDVDMVVEWYEKQPHLPKVPLDRDFVERFLIGRKGSVEQTKQRIELIYTYRTLVPDLAAPRDVLHPDLQRQFHSVVYASMPRLNHDLSRVQIYKLTPNSEMLTLADTVKYMLMIIDFRLKNDYALGERYIFDFQHMTMAHLAKFNPVLFGKIDVYFKSYGFRLFGFHYINAPPFLGALVNIVKAGMSAKMTERLVVHSSLDDLHKVISKEILPKEYGGDEDALEVHAAKWKEEFTKEENRQYLIKQESLKSNEALRIEPRPSDDMLGIPGSFKTINVD